MEIKLQPGRSGVAMRNRTTADVLYETSGSLVQAETYPEFPTEYSICPYALFFTLAATEK